MRQETWASLALRYGTVSAGPGGLTVTNQDGQEGLGTVASPEHVYQGELAENDRYARSRPYGVNVAGACRACGHVAHALQTREWDTHGIVSTIAPWGACPGCGATWDTAWHPTQENAV